MESVEVQQVETAVTETETQHITQAQIATLAQVTDDVNTIGCWKSSIFLLWGSGSAAGYQTFRKIQILNATNVKPQNYSSCYSAHGRQHGHVTSEFQVTMTAGHATATGPTVTFVQLPNGQTVQVHGVIQAAQPSVIQSPQIQTVQVKHTHTHTHVLS